MNEKQLRETADNLFTKRSNFDNLLQEISENYYPERSDFTIRRELGDEFAANLMTTYPVLARRDLGNQLGAMLRPASKEWFSIAVKDERVKDLEGKQWLDWAKGVQRRAMYDRKSLFTRATKEGDHDFAAFGQTVLSVRMNRNSNGLLYRCWHLRDVVWMENEEGIIGFIARKWQPYCRDLRRLFGGNCHPDVINLAERSPYDEVKCYHFIVEADMFDGDSKGRPYWSILYDCDHERTIEVQPVWNKEYVIPRWQTVSGSQYAFSPATIVSLPDARLIQAMTYTLLEAGEKYTNPPMVATQDAIRSDVAIYAGGITWVDEEYDERLGDALRPLNQDYRGFPAGIEMQRESQALIARAFYLDKLNLPTNTPEMTAYEVGQRIQQYIRDAMPIFEPMEDEYNGALCDETFELLMRNGAFGSPANMPDSLREREIQFKFESPLHEAVEAQKGAKWLEAKNLLADAIALDPSTAMDVDARKALRDTLIAVGVPAPWLRNKNEADKIIKRMNEKAEAQRKLDSLEQGSNIAANVSKAGQDATL